MSLSRACREAGVNYKTLHAQLTHGREIPFPTIDKISRYSGLPLEYFSDFRPNVAIRSPEGSSELQQRVAKALEIAVREQSMDMMRAGYSIGTDDVLDWLRANGGVIQDFDGIRQHVDLYHQVIGADYGLRPHQIGTYSLATRSFGAQDEDHYQQIVNGFDKGLIESVVADHMEAASRDYLLSDRAIKVLIAGEHVAVAYRRLIAPVRDVYGNKFNLVFARRIYGSPEMREALEVDRD
ncbi:hypothetical protein [Candidatus Rhodobacter oscarellae]|uniref:hypothetical protein n=1 Tax=Candidatus Rhodobacter oscarellae TaxID=1675527 RepID=UPI00067165DB|nr:hypothetical protein [Candidatus Rhodobacter lobularis]